MRLIFVVLIVVFLDFYVECGPGQREYYIKLEVDDEIDLDEFNIRARTKKDDGGLQSFIGNLINMPKFNKAAPAETEVKIDEPDLQVAPEPLDGNEDVVKTRSIPKSKKSVNKEGNIETTESDAAFPEDKQGTALSGKPANKPKAMAGTKSKAQPKSDIKPNISADPEVAPETGPQVKPKSAPSTTKNPVLAP